MNSDKNFIKTKNHWMGCRLSSRKEGYTSFVKSEIQSVYYYDKCTDYRLKKYGGTIVNYTVLCSNCKSMLFAYQKDGAGPLKRCYIDRIIGISEYFNITNYKELQCDKIISHPQSIYFKTELVAKPVRFRNRTPNDQTPELYYENDLTNHIESRGCYELIY
jgi:hypothetical protein